MKSFPRTVSRLCTSYLRPWRRALEFLTSSIVVDKSTPGPGAYNLDSPMTRVRTPAASFGSPRYDSKSSVISRLLHSREGGSGPGEYDPKEPSAPRAPSALFRRTKRFAEQEEGERSQIPGPGAYHLKGGIADGGRGVAFRTGGTRLSDDVCDFDRHMVTPGPGAYDLAKYSEFDISHKPKGIAFSVTPRFGERKCFVPVRQLRARRRDIVVPSLEALEANQAAPSRSRTDRERGAVWNAERVRENHKAFERRRDRRRKRLLNVNFKAIAEAARLGYKPREEQRRRIQTLWLPLMKLAARAQHFTEILRFYRANRDHITRVKRAALRIQRWYRSVRDRRRRAEQRRREQLYGWMVLRKIRSIHFRHVSHRKNQAAEIIKMLLVFERRKLLKGVKTFRFKVLRIQTFWKHRMRLFRSVLHTLDLQWRRVEDLILGMYREDELRKELTRQIKLHSKAAKRAMTGKEMEEARIAMRESFVDPVVPE